MTDQNTELSQLKERIELLETSQKFEADQEAVQSVQMEMLTKLREIRAEMVVVDGSGSGVATSSSEMEALRAENEALKKINAKHEYRIKHLVRSLEELLAK